MIYPIRKRITKIEETNAVTIPISRIAASVPVKFRPNFTSFRRLAPNITGIASTKVNSAATVLDTPRIKAPTIVAPDLDVPGKIAAISWKSPIKNAVL